MPRDVGFTVTLAVLVLERVRLVRVDHDDPVQRCSRIDRPLWFGATVVRSVTVDPLVKEVRLALQ